MAWSTKVLGRLSQKGLVGPQKPIDDTAYRAGHMLCTAVAELAFRLKIHGRENLIEEGTRYFGFEPCELPRSALLGLLVARRSSIWPARACSKSRVLGPVLTRVNCIPIDRDRGDVAAVRAILRLLKEGKRTLLFPEGTRSRDGKLQPARGGLGLIIAKSLAPVVPVRIFGILRRASRSGGIHFSQVTMVVVNP